MQDKQPLNVETFVLPKLSPRLSLRERGRLPRDKGLKVANETQKSSQVYSECNKCQCLSYAFLFLYFIFYHLVAFGYDCVTF